MGLHFLRFAAMAVAAIGVMGCGSGASFHGVEGKVTLDNAPLSGAYVSITPKDGTLATDPKLRGPYVGAVDDQGHFALGAVGDVAGGAPAGDYTLVITTTHTTVIDENEPPPAERVPAPYSSPGVDFTVPDGGTADANFNLKSK